MGINEAFTPETDSIFIRGNMTLEDRIRFHEIMRRNYNDKKDELEERLNRYNEKIIYHTTAIMNLEKKRREISGI